MAKFFETFDVIEGDGTWQAQPYPIDTWAGGIKVLTEDICTPPTPTNEVQTITVNGAPTGGTFTLALDGQVTPSGVAYDASASTVQTALQALSTIGSGNATVAGSAGGPYVVTFAGALGDIEVDAIVGDGTLLTGGTDMSVTVQVTTPGNVKTPNSYPLTRLVAPFAITDYAIVPPRCTPTDYGDFVIASLIKSREYVITNSLWYGPSNPESDMYLEHPDVQVLERGSSDPYTLIGAALQAAFAKTPFIKPVIHLGFQSALALQLGLANLELPFVVAEGYPPNAIAVTDSVVVRIGSVQFISRVDTSLNRTYYEGSQIAAVEFDPGIAVRVSDS